MNNVKLSAQSIKEKICNLFDKETFLTAFIVTIFVHGQMLFNKISWHDDISLFNGWGDGLNHGRWFYHIMERWMSKCAGMEPIPSFNGIVSSFSIAIMSCLILDIFQIKNKVARFSLVLIFASIPAVTGNFGYMVTAGLNFVGMTFAVIAAYVLCKTPVNGKGKWKGLIISAFFLACAIGEYQCYLAFYLSLMLLFLIKKSIKESLSLERFISTGVFYIVTASAGLIIYLIILQYYICVGRAVLTHYANTDTYGIVSLLEYFMRFKYAYRAFFNPSLVGHASMFPVHNSTWYILLLVINSIILLLFIIRFLIKKNIICLGVIVSILLIPAVLNFNFILYGNGTVHSLHQYHLVLLFVIPFIFLSDLAKEKNNIVIRLQRILTSSSLIITLAWGFLYIRYDNYCYTLNEMRQQKAISYFTTLSTRIQTVRGYDPSYHVAFLNAENKANNVDKVNAKFDYPVTNPYNFPIVNSYNWYSLMENWTGYRPIIADVSAYAENPEVLDMPSYPSDGSIKIIGKTIVVKF